VTNVNRMIGVLFKMTGLTRFLNDEQKSAPALIIPNAQTSNAASIAPIYSAASNDGKLKLWVEAQNSYQMNGWYFFNTYLQRQLGREVHLN